MYDEKAKISLFKLIKNNYGLISTGTTGEKIRSIGFSCIDISKITNLKKCLMEELRHLIH